MKILTAAQIRSADAFTIANEPVASIDLMERAAKACVAWIKKNRSLSSCKIFCGPGNNGGDGLAIARMLHADGIDAQVYIVRQTDKYSSDFLENEKRLKQFHPEVIHDLKSENDFPVIEKGNCIVEAIFGTGLTKELTGLYSNLVKHINHSEAEVISIDMPAGLMANQHTAGSVIVHAAFTLSFQLPKLAFLFPENEKNVGDFHLLDIGLNRKFIDEQISQNYYVTREFIRPLLRGKKKFSHKGDYGHALLVAGSKGKMGAAVLAAKGCLRTGVGLLSMLIPGSGVQIMQVSCPEAMVAGDEINFEKFSAIGAGPGIGTDGNSKQILKRILKHASSPLVLDADALNLISEGRELLKRVPPNSIFTPHPKEFERLAGTSKNNFERHQLQLSFSKKHQVLVVLKGAHSCITTPEGNSFFNSTGNPGMAKGGSGDVLTGMITSLLAQGYSPEESALLGVYLHGLAGDIAAEKIGMDAMIAGDIVDGIHEAWKKFK
jgi:hydroxyethylthiazole kinase-like uncharacterized protein yjeF